MPANRPVFTASIVRTLATLAALAILTTFATSPAAWASGFETGQEGVKAMGVAGAYTAIADDPTAIYYNIGGLALLGKPVLTIGTSAYSLQRSQYQGRSPGIGAGTTGEQEVVRTILPHAYLALPFGTKAKVGLGVYSPYAIDTDWANPASFPGRTVSLTSQVRTVDISPGISLAVTKKFGIGLAAIYRFSDLASSRRIQLPDPITAQPRDVASVNAGTDFNGALGFTVGVLHRPTDKFSWGLSYKSPIEISYTGSGSLTQLASGNAQLDQLATAQFPFNLDLPIQSRIQFPASAALGIAVGKSKGVQVAFDLGWAQWNQFDGTGVTFVNNPSLSYVLQGTYQDAFSYRLGLRWTVHGGAQFRFGGALEKTPQPDASLNPFFPDADRTILALGYGLDWLDIGLQWVRFDDRLTFSNPNGLNGLYRNEAWILAVSMTKMNR
ncbi:MAG TPA: outer membrane protein transport protein [Thermoanaerobaculia bacterium]|jgi:long-chain fatty acid transport protein|nr:outer membrane protein transport protein [Thermoanaerobaculia bacterium]